MKYRFLLIFLLFFLASSAQVKLYVAPHGSDKNQGTRSKPFQSPGAALAHALSYTGKDVIIEFRKGTYELENTIEIRSRSFLLQSLELRGADGERVVFSGAKKINFNWQPYKNRILKAALPLQELPDRLFANGKALPMARYPNYDSTARNFNGSAAEALSDERVKSWQHPAGGYIHALHHGEWGGFHYRITGKGPEGKLQYEGGWQNNRPAPMHPKHRFVENIFEELDAPGEWFYDQTGQTLYLYPPQGLDLKNAQFSMGHLTDLIRMIGTADQPVKNVSIRNIQFICNNRSFMLTKEPLLRSDWTIYRGGAILLDGTENIKISNCAFSELGGNAIFLSNYNKNDQISDNHIYDIGASAIAFVGDPAAVRSPAFRYEWFVPWNEMDFSPGPASTNYPQYCTAKGNLIHNIGTVEKQVAGVHIEMAARLTVSHNSIYKTPRSGINIGDGCWGGHVLEHNDVFNTVLETGDHGAFNSWGRDRFWRPDRKIIDSVVAAKPGIELLDVKDPIIIRNNRFQCEHGWDIDLDDGSTNYRIYDNVCLSGGIKLREGYHRSVRNNIMINNSFHPHVWLKNSRDTFMYNIVTTPYAPILIDDWGKTVDSNFFLVKAGLSASQKLNNDLNSLYGDALFRDEKNGIYEVNVGSPANRVGFRNVEMDFGVTDPALKKLAESPAIKPLITKLGEAKGEMVEWLGAKFKNIETLGERSAAGLPNDQGALLVELPVSSIAAKSGLQKGDVIIKMGEQDVQSVSGLLNTFQQVKWMGGVDCIIFRNQSGRKIRIAFN